METRQGFKMDYWLFRTYDFGYVYVGSNNSLEKEKDIKKEKTNA